MSPINALTRRPMLPYYVDYWDDDNGGYTDLDPAELERQDLDFDRHLNELVDQDRRQSGMRYLPWDQQLPNTAHRTPTIDPADTISDLPSLPLRTRRAY